GGPGAEALRRGLHPAKADERELRSDVGDVVTGGVDVVTALERGVGRPDLGARPAEGIEVAAQQQPGAEDAGGKEVRAQDGYRPVNFAGRFSRKAFMPSFMSSVEAQSPKSVAS